MGAYTALICFVDPEDFSVKFNFEQYTVLSDHVILKSKKTISIDSSQNDVDACCIGQSN